MKVLLHVFLLLSFSVKVYSQSYESPVGWQTTNGYSISNGAGVTVTKSNNSQSGSYAVQLEGKYSGVLGKTIPGIITTGVLNGIDVSAGQPHQIRSQKLTGYYKYSPADADKAGVEVLLSKWNKVSGKRDTIAYGFSAKTAVANYSPFEVILVYKNVQVPDSQLVVVSSSENRIIASAGSILLVDNLSFTGIVPMEEPSETEEIALENSFSPALVFPNPASEKIIIRPWYEVQSISIINFIGQEIYSGNAISARDDNEIKISLKEGIYFIRIQYKSGFAEVVKLLKKI